MVQRSSLARDRKLRQFGENVRNWRTIQGISASELARRAHVTRATLSSIEKGLGAAKFDSVFAVVNALGFVDALVASTDPFSSEAGQAITLSRG
ncbi:MAG: helix-turn-helix transcriptional regulator [Actinobacteria bacterium]|nr:helix-turn-helix transcriptional regulator [Actinomycetota bacterium]